MEKFTQGEWLAFYPHEVLNEGVMSVEGEDGQLICKAEVYKSNIDERVANAHLIAAAPHGFALGKLVMDLCGQPHGVSEQQSDLLYETALEFIKKARGES